MAALDDRAAGLRAWATESQAPPEVIAESLVEADQSAVFWHVAELVLTESQIDQIKRTTDKLLENGYEIP